MEPLYAVDGSLTEKVKNFDRRLVISGYEAAAFCFAFVPILATTVICAARASEEGILATQINILLVLCYSGFINWLPRLLKKFHEHWDFEGANARRKRYSDGYNAWAKLLGSIVCLLVSLLVWDTSFGLALILLGEIWLPLSYFEFVSRREDRGGKKRKLAISDTLSEFLGRFGMALKTAN